MSNTAPNSAASPSHRLKFSEFMVETVGIESKVNVFSTTCRSADDTSGHAKQPKSDEQSADWACLKIAEHESLTRALITLPGLIMTTA